MKPNVKAKFIKRCGNVPYKEVDGDVLLISLKDGDYYGLNQTGMEIWKMLDGTKKIDEIAHALSKKFKISLKKATQDTRIFLRELKKSDLIELV